jgi:hypothetical protein
MFLCQLKIRGASEKIENLPRPLLRPRSVNLSSKTVPLRVETQGRTQTLSLVAGGRRVKRTTENKIYWTHCFSLYKIVIPVLLIHEKQVTTIFGFFEKMVYPDMCEKLNS